MSCRKFDDDEKRWLSFFGGEGEIEEKYSMIWLVKKVASRTAAAMHWMLHRATQKRSALVAPSLTRMQGFKIIADFSVATKNKGLVSACQTILEEGTSLPTLSSAEEAALLDLVQTVGASVPSPTDAFRAIENMKTAYGNHRRNEKMRTAIAVIARQQLPKYVAETVIDVEPDELEAPQRMHYEALLLNILSGCSTDEDLQSSLMAIEASAPALLGKAPFVAMLVRMDETLLAARIGHLISRCFEEFDKAKLGRIRVEDVRCTLSNLLPREAVDGMLRDVAADAEGCITYDQLTKVLVTNNAFSSQNPNSPL